MNIKILTFLVLTSTQSLLIAMLNLFGLLIILKSRYGSIKNVKQQQQQRHQQQIQQQQRQSFPTINQPRQQQTTLNLKLIVALFLSHVGLGISRLVVDLLMKLGNSKNHTSNTCIQIFGLAQYSFSCLEIGFTVIISIERYLTIRFPLNFEKNKKLYQRCYFISPLFLTLILSVGSIFSQDIVLFISWIMALLGVLLILITNGLLYLIVQKHNKSITALMVHPSSKLRIDEVQRRKKRQRRSFKICAMITISYVCLWMPYLTFSMFIGANYILWATLDFLAYFNPLLDVLIYLAWMKNTRRTIKNLICSFGL